MEIIKKPRGNKVKYTHPKIRRKKINVFFNRRIFGQEIEWSLLAETAREEMPPY